MDLVLYIACISLSVHFPHVSQLGAKVEKALVVPGHRCKISPRLSPTDILKDALLRLLAKRLDLQLCRSSMLFELLKFPPGKYRRS